MATEAALTIDIQPLKLAIGEFTRKYGYDETVLLKDQVRMLLQTLIKGTPPETQKAGRETVRRDVLKMAQHAYEEHYDLLQLKRDAKRSKDGHVYRWWDGKLKQIPISALDFDGSKIERDRPKFRDSRGRVRRGSNIVTSLRIVKRVAKKVFPHVGNVKRGWLAAAQALGATLPPFALKSVSGPSGKASGGIRDYSAATFFDKSITIWNDTPYIRDDGSLRRAMQVRLKDIKNQLIKRLEKRAEEVSAT